MTNKNTSSFFKGMLARAKRIYHSIEDMESPHPVYQAARQLKDKIDVAVHGPYLPERVKAAGEALSMELGKALLAYDQSSKGRGALNYANNIYKLRRQCSTAIKKYSPVIQAEPGFWNQIKEEINCFFGVEIFETKKSLIGNSIDYQEKLQTLKNEIEESENTRYVM